MDRGAAKEALGESWRFSLAWVLYGSPFTDIAPQDSEGPFKPGRWATCSLFLRPFEKRHRREILWRTRDS